MIPVLIVPVLNHPELFADMLRSIDHPVGTLLVIDNSPALEMGDVADRNIPATVGQVRVIEPPRNLGVAASWNLGIKSYPEAEWWLIANADVAFGPDDLARLDEAMTDGSALRCLIEFAAFGLPRSVVDEVGLFDENFAPIYYEDTDYRYRCGLAGIPIIDIPSKTRHVESVSYRGNHHAADNARTFPANADYYRRKWGGPKGAERYRSPFDAGLPLWAWSLDVARLAAQAWPSS